MTASEDLFTPIHKGLRAMLYDLSGRLQTNDFADLEQTKALTRDLERDFAIARSAGCVVCVLAHHAEDEESAIFPNVKVSPNGLISSLVLDHQNLTRREMAITSCAHRIVELGSADERLREGAALNRAANELFAAYMTHMNREEAELVPLMQGQFTDAQMGAMQGTIIGRMPPDRLFAILGWMLPALNATELAHLLGSMKQTAPPPVLKALTDLCAARVEPARWAAVKLKVGI